MDFVQPTEPSVTMQSLPSVAMRFNGKYFENEIEGYRTLNVSGREMFSYDLMSERRSNGDGSHYYGKTRPSGVVSVTYKLESKTAIEMQEKYNELRKLLYSNEEVPIQFNDEPNITYYGTHDSSEEVPSDRLVVISGFTIFCPNPEKIKDTVTTDGEVTINTFYKTYPLLITIETATTTNTLSVTNGVETITLTGPFNAGSIIKIDVVNQIVLVNEIERVDVIDLESDFENFEIKEGQIVTANNGTLELEMREVV